MEPDFDAMDTAQMSAAVDALLGTVMERQWRVQWWESEMFTGQTPRQMLEDKRFRQLWLLAEATVAPEARDITEIEHIRD